MELLTQAAVAVRGGQVLLQLLLRPQVVLAAAVLVLLRRVLTQQPQEMVLLILAVAAAVAVGTEVVPGLMVVTVVQVSSLFATLALNVVRVEQYLAQMATPIIHLHHPELTQHDGRAQTSSCYVSERRIDALRSCT